jgi:hypothetical protein
MKSAQLVSLLLTLSGVTLASAQAPAERTARTGQRGPTPLVLALDADRDGEVSLREIRDAFASLRLLDTDADGTLSYAELHPGRAPDATAEDARRPQRIDPVMLALDADQDGELSPFEAAAARTRLLALDGNDDGKLTRDELHSAPTE